MREAARQLAARVAEPPSRQRSRILDRSVQRAYLIALARTGRRCRAGRRRRSFLDEQSRLYAADAKADERLAVALADFCQVLLGLNEFVYVD